MNTIVIGTSPSGYKRMRSEDFYESLQSTTLPQDVLKLIFTELTFKKLGSISSVCREWNQLANDPSLLKEIVYR